jgi:excisionase family DNA binding protein
MAMQEVSKQSVMQNTKIAYSVEELSKLISLSKGFIRKEIKAGNLKAKNFGRRILILNEDLKTYLDGNQEWKPKAER